MFQRKDGYYTGVVYEWNLPTGWTCPGANACLVRVNRHTGIGENLSTEFKCYAASAERFPGVRSSRWGNLEEYEATGIPELPEGAVAVRIHSSGDFFRQSYFDDWLDYCAARPAVSFWAYTKSLPFWVKRLGDIPDNLVLTASVGGKCDRLIVEHGLRRATVIPSTHPRARIGPVDTNDDLARVHGPDFFLVDNADREA